MFESLKKKLFSLIGKEEPKKEPKKKSKGSKKAVKKAQKPIKEKKKTVKEKIVKKPQKEKPSKVQQVQKSQEPQKEAEKPQVKHEEKTSFLSSITGIFKSKPKEEEKKEGTEHEEKPLAEKLPEEKEVEEIPEEKVEAEETEEEGEEVDEETEEEEKEEPKKENFFSRLVKKISAAELTNDQFDEIFQELEITLLENNVALEAVDKIKETLSKDLVGQSMKKEEAEKKVLVSLKESILSLLIEPPDLLERIKQSQSTYTILFFGINGTGKTTSVAKLAHLLKKNNISCVLAAADTFRAASIEQLKTHADRIGVPIISSQYGADPASVAFDAVAYAKKNNIKAVLIDTAGRMYTKENLLKEMEKVVRVAKPDLKLFVGESITGNDAIDQARTFNEAINIDGIILSKADIDEKAGTILSVSHVTGKPIYFLGTGQNYDDLQVFTKDTVLKNLGLE